MRMRGMAGRLLRAAASPLLLLAGLLSGFPAAGASAAGCPGWDGTQPPNPAGSFDQLFGVAAVSACDVWAVGGTSQATLAEHWTGSSWSVVPSPAPGAGSAFLGVSALSASDAWAVGGYSIGNFVDTLIEHWDGQQWIVQQSVPSPGDVGILNGVSAVSSSDAWAVGSYDDANGETTFILRWDGHR